MVEVASIPANAFFSYTTSIVYGASFQQSASVSQFMPWMFVEGIQQAKNARIAHDFIFGFGALNGTGLAVEAPIGSHAPPSTFGTQVIKKVPGTTTYAMIFAPGKSVADFEVDTVRDAFALQCGVSTATVAPESEPLDGCPSWDLSQELRVALVQHNVHAFGRLFCSILRVETDHARLVGLKA